MTTTRFHVSRFIGAVLALVLTLAAGNVSAQGLFAPAIKVGDEVVTQFEFQQRVRLLEVLNAPGDPEEIAQQQLIDDRLRLEAARQVGAELEEGELATGKTEFAARANLTSEQFVQALAGAGVAEQTFDDFVRAGLLWRKVVRGRYGRLVDITDRDIDQVLTTSGSGDNVRVLISEIFIPTPPGQEGQAQAIASQIARITTLEGFAAAAREYSAAPSGRSGGRVNWMNVPDMPPALRQVILGLKVGEVSSPLTIPGAIALFQLRAIEEGEFKPRKVTGIDYAAYYLAGGRSEATLAEAAKLRNTVDTCDDLYGVAKGQPPSVLDRGEKALGEIPTDVAYELAKLDTNEVSTALTRSNGQTLVFLMLCKRNTEAAEGVDREELRAQLQNAKLESYGATLLEQLRAETRIVIY
ncbi:peptidylprolyl isomerase [Oceanicola sp. 22II-s10i]|nr:peptidylprolyl isomerase [Oceanicola sp. 22II-s10i]